MSNSIREQSYQAWVDELLERISVLEASKCNACKANMDWLAKQLATEGDELSFESSGG